MSGIILDLCAGTGAWSEPYRQAGYDVRQVEIWNGDDVRLFEHIGRIHGVLAAPPCNHLSRAGANTWEQKGELALMDALSVVDACLRVCVLHRPEFWALENPEGRIRKYLGPPAFVFQPWWYGDPWTKKTLLWGNFRPPICRRKVYPLKGSLTDVFSSDNKEREKNRSITPPGFARAFFEANP